jgi:hypothetical protein
VVWISERRIHTIVVVGRSQRAGSGPSSVSTALRLKVAPWAEWAIWRARTPTPFAPRLSTGKPAACRSIACNPAAESRGAVRARIFIIRHLEELIGNFSEEA